MNISTNLHAGVIPGSYLDTCNEIDEEYLDYGYTKLSASCQQDNGVWRSNILIVPPFYNGDISNCDGGLTLGSC